MKKKAEVRACGICGRWLSDSNKSPDRCFHHQTPAGKAGERILKARDMHETFVRGAAPKCSSPTQSGLLQVTIDYHGSPKDF